MFYLTTHSNTFYLRLYGVGHMVKDHSDSEREKEETRCRHMTGVAKAMVCAILSVGWCI